MVPSPRMLVSSVILVFAMARGVQRVLTALTLRELGPWSVTALSLVLACLIWFPLAWFRGWLVVDPRLWMRSIPLGLVNIAIPGVAFIAAQQFVTASLAALLVASLPLVVVLMARIVLRERLTARALVGVLVGGAGVVTLTVGKGGAVDAANLLVGVGLIGLGVVAAASVYVGWRGLLAEHPAVVILGPQLLVSCLIVACVSLVVEGVPNPSRLAWAELALLALVNYVVPHLAMFGLLSHTSTVRSSLANYLAPLFATALAVPVLGQGVSTPILVGGALIITGAALVNMARTKQDESVVASPRRFGPARRRS